MSKLDRSYTSRALRYNEYLRLKALPFLDPEQYKKLQWLKSQRIKDNRQAFEENKKSN